MDTVEQGRITIAPEVLTTICRLSTRGVQGVDRMASVPGGVNRLWKRTSTNEGVRIVVDDQAVTIDVYVIVRPDHSLVQVSREIQASVARAIEQITGMNVVAVNVHIEDVSYEAPSSSP